MLPMLFLLGRPAKRQGVLNKLSAWQGVLNLSLFLGKQKLGHSNSWTYLYFLESNSVAVVRYGNPRIDGGFGSP